MNEKAKKLWWFTSGALVGLTSLSLAGAAIPKTGRVTDDTAIYQNLSEVRVAKQADLNFDPDIQKLAALEGDYREELPGVHPRLAAPMQRISKQKYRYSGGERKRSVKR